MVSEWNAEVGRLLLGAVAVVAGRTRGTKAAHLRPRGVRRLRRAAGVTIVHLQPPKTQGAASTRAHTRNLDVTVKLRTVPRVPDSKLLTRTRHLTRRSQTLISPIISFSFLASSVVTNWSS